VKVGRRDICDELVYGGNAKVDYVDIRNGMTPLMYAIMGRHVDIVRMLLREGASLTMCDFKCTTPLMMAAATGMVPMLEAVGGQYTKMVDAQDEKGWTALHWAVFADSPAAIVYLLDVLVANRDIKDHERKKPYHLAAFLKYGDCESVLMDKHMKMAVAVGDHLL
jgi:ankyrin repeat protein